jgi:SAM-dependent methyltransferase
VRSEETHGLGYERVDSDPNASVLLATMDATARWPATAELRAWERGQLGLCPGQRLLDVGCGLGDAGIALAADLGDDGELVGVDVSRQMTAAARSRADDLTCRVRFSVGDAAALDEADDRFDAVRSERTLQWLPDPRAAVAEMSRVARPGGQVSLIDSDWSTFAIDIDDDDIAARVRETMRVERARPCHVGGRLAELARACGLEPVLHTSATQTWTEWDPDSSPAPDGCFSMTSLADDLIGTGNLALDAREDFVERIHQAARERRFTMALTMFAVIARLPANIDPLVTATANNQRPTTDGPECRACGCVLGGGRPAIGLRR